MSWLNLEPHQREAINRMKNGCILCGGVGTGKSRTALAYYFRQQGGDIDSFHYKNLSCGSVQSLYIITTAQKRDKKEWDIELLPFRLNEYDVQIKIDSWNNIPKYTDVQGAFFIFDEQRVVGYGAWTKSFLKIAKQNNWILLTATPGDRWIDYMPVFIANGFYKNKTDFMGQHVLTQRRANRYDEIVGYTGTGRLIRLRNNILIDMNYTRKTISHHEDYMAEYDKKAYREITKLRWNPYTNQPILNANEYCSVVRRLVNSDVSRQVLLLEVFEDHPKLIVFYNFDYELDILRSIPWGTDVEVAEWNGHKHQPIPETDSWIYLVQYIAGAEGWNCILTNAIVFYSQTYSYRTLTQAEGRINRLNTPYKDLYYYHIKSRSPIDIAIGRALTEKKQFNEMRFFKGIANN